MFFKKESEKTESKANESKKPDTEKLAMKVSFISITVNMMLSVVKLIAGLIGHSGAMVSDAVHSASDVFSTFVVIVGIKISGKRADDDHPYGHERMECVAAIILAVVLALTGIGIGFSGFKKITEGNYDSLAVPGMLPLVAAVVSIGVKEWMFWFTRGAAKKVNSGALMADAWHHRSDALSSVGSLIGIIGARSGYPVMDPIASLIICIFIVKAAIDIFKDAVDKMVDKACPQEVVAKMCDTIMNCSDVEKIDLIRTRLFGAKIFVEVEIAVDGNKTLFQAHEVAEKVHKAIEADFEDVKHCTVHVNPANNSGNNPS